jgi:hypothetical protein
MIGEQKFISVVDGERYKLSDGTSIEFMPGGAVTNEELLGVLLHRLRVQGRRVPCKETSRAITALESCEEILWRRDIRRGQEKEAAA